MDSEKTGFIDKYSNDFTESRIAYWNKIAPDLDQSHLGSKYYHTRLTEIYRNLITKGQRIVEFGCGTGNLLSALDPVFGVGIDFSSEMIQKAKKNHPGLHFVQANVHQPVLSGTFDVIILSDLVNDIWDVQKVFEQASRLSHPGTRLIVNYYSRLWELPLSIAQKMGFANPILDGNWLTVEDISNLLYLTGFEPVRNWHEILWPFPIPLIAPFFNRFLVRLWPFNHLALTNFTIARPKPQCSPPAMSEKPIVSVIVPARNEAGNIAEIIERVPEMGGGTEIIFVEGHSCDTTYQTIREEICKHPEKRLKMFQQSGVGKGDAVRLGFSEASGEILMILDADLTVPPETLPQFYDAIYSRKGDFINGVRLVYPMEKQAMRLMNFLGNKFFTYTFSWMLGQSIKDTLCGTKVLWKEDYCQIAANRSYFGDFDPFGDFDLIFGAVKINRKIIDLPIRYRERKYGTTNIQRWKHGWLLIKMLIVAAGRIKFI